MDVKRHESMQRPKNALGNILIYMCVHGTFHSCSFERLTKNMLDIHIYKLFHYLNTYEKVIKTTFHKQQHFMDSFLKLPSSSVFYTHTYIHTYLLTYSVALQFL
jgi:hypothetical protein